MKFSNDSPVGIAILGIISLFLAVWAFMTARDPKTWRRWWMAIFGRTGLNTTREQRYLQQQRLSIAGYVAFALLLGVAAISVYHVIASIKGQPQVRSDYDKAMENIMSDKEKFGKTQKRR